MSASNHALIAEHAHAKKEGTVDWKCSWIKMFAKFVLIKCLAGLGCFPIQFDTKHTFLAFMQYYFFLFLCCSLPGPFSLYLLDIYQDSCCCCWCWFSFFCCCTAGLLLLLNRIGVAKTSQHHNNPKYGVLLLRQDAWNTTQMVFFFF